MMNMQGVNFFVPLTQTKGDSRGRRSVRVDWIPGCRGAKRWRLMRQAKTKVLGMRCETGAQCIAVTDDGGITERER